MEEFEKFIKTTRPPWLVKLEKSEDPTEPVYTDKTTMLFYLAWLMGMGYFGIEKFVDTFMPGEVDKFDRHCFKDNRAQRLYWCYLNGRACVTGKLNVPLLEIV